MSYEYSATAALTDGEVRQLKASLLDHGLVLRVQEEPRRILLRFARRPAREQWPEDIELRFGEVVYVAFHSASGAERREFLEHLESRLSRIGHVCSFEEP